MIRILRLNGLSFTRRVSRRLVGDDLLDRFRIVVTLLQYAADGADAELETGPGKRLSDPLLSHRRAKHFQPNHDVPNEIGKAVDRLRRLKKCAVSFLVDALGPLGDGRGSKEESHRHLRLRPSTCGLELENPQAFRSAVVRSTTRLHPSHPKIFQLELLLEKRDLRVSLFKRGPQLRR